MTLVKLTGAVMTVLSLSVVTPLFVATPTGQEIRLKHSRDTKAFERLIPATPYACLVRCGVWCHNFL
jgi:hypothetical protein